MSSHGHSKADKRHLHLHRVAFEKLGRHPELLHPVLELLERWLADNAHQPSRPWLLQWRDMLTNWSIERTAERVLAMEEGQPLRQCSPLAPVLTPQERWAALEEVNQALQAAQTEPDPQRP